MAHQPVTDPATFAKIGDEIEVKVLGVEERGGQLRISLSRKALIPAPAGTAPAAPGPAPATAAAPRDSRPRDGRPRDSRPRDGHLRDGRAPDGRARDGRARDAAAGPGAGREWRPDDRRPDEGHPPLDRDPRRGEREQRRAADRATDAKLARLGEILLAKLKGNLPER
jgi:hypothetical protein